MAYEQYPESDPRHHTLKMRQEFEALVSHLRDDVEKVQDPRAQAMFETAAEVLKGLSTTFTHFEQQSEPAWRR